MKLDKALSLTGYVKCGFGPDSDGCDQCGKAHRQMYYSRTCYEVDEGEYRCSKCVISLGEEIDSITEIECPTCKTKYTAFSHEAGSDCFDCFVSKSDMPT